MKIKRLDAGKLADNLPPPSPAFTADTMAQLRAMAQKEDKPIMKRKAFTTILIAALLLALLAATALAYSLTRSPQAAAVSKARAVLSDKYGLTPETIGLFNIVPGQKDGTWTITFRADGFYPLLLGDYTVILAPGKEPDAGWTHDGVDPALWKGGDLDAPVWGQPQMLKALTDKEGAEAAVKQMDWSSVPGAVKTTPSPAPLNEGEFRWFGQILREGNPGSGDMKQEEALELAVQALMEDASLSRGLLDAADVSAAFYTRDGGNPIWGFQIYLVNNGIELGCGVMVDARTGEILLTNVVSGGNG